jgi:hypothetical protein
MKIKGTPTDRHLELSSKFIEMGKALMQEGREKKDYAISQSGTFMILMGGLMFDETDIQLFGQLCAMFSAKKVLDSMDAKNEVDLFFKNKADNETFEDYIKRLNKLKGDADSQID